MWLSEQKEPDWHPQPLSACGDLCLSTIPCQSPDQKPQMASGVAEMWMLIQIPCLAGQGVATGWESSSLSVAGAASGPDHLQLPVLPR